MLPNWLGIGAPRAGTTTIWEVLRHHKDVYLPTQKEAEFWGRPGSENSAADIVRYEATFFAGCKCQKAVGEITPCYLVYERAPRDIREGLGAATKLVVTLRHPVRRAFSHYQFNIRSRDEKGSFADAMLPERLHSVPVYRNCMRLSLYGHALKRYFDSFSRENFHFMLYEREIETDLSGGIRRLLQFLEVDANFEIDIKTHLNRSGDVRILAPDEDTTVEVPRADGYGLYQAFLPANSVAMLCGWHEWDVVIAKPSEEARRFFLAAKDNITRTLDPTLEHDLMKSLFLDDIRKTEDLIDMDLSVWYKDHI